MHDFLKGFTESFVYSVYVPEIDSEIGSSKVLEEEIESPMNGNEARRHLKQTSSILHMLEKGNLFKPQTCFIEFGSGKGKRYVKCSCINV